MAADELRKLDAEIAEKVMGWGRAKGGALYLPGTDGTHISHYPDVPDYSTELEDAWKVVENMATTFDPAFHWLMTLENCTTIKGEVVWWARFYPSVWVAGDFGLSSGTQNAPENVNEWQKTAPLAICLAAVRATPASPPSPSPAV